VTLKEGLAMIKPERVPGSLRVVGAFVLAMLVAGMSAAPDVVAASGVSHRRVAAVGGSLAGVAATSARNAWAVGHAGTIARPRTLILRWQGTAWQKVSAPGLGASGSLAGIAATSARNAWAVGNAGTTAHPRTLILRWQGRAWQKVSAPGLGASGSLAGIAATSARNAWAVGSTGHADSVGYSGKALILRWNGSAWRSVRCPRPGIGSVLYAVTAVSAASAWAVGSYVTKAEPFGVPYIARWDGRTWKQVRFQFGLLSGATATSVRNAWAVGGTGGDGLDFPLIVHWNGNSWKQAHAPAPASGGHFFGVAAASPTTVWAVGLTYGSSTNFLLARWNGHAWKRVRTAGRTSGALMGVAAISASNAWAVGYSGTASRPAILILHWNGSSWRAG
jgi:hypothetical protein